MVDNQHQKIIGYRDLSNTEIEAMNTIKATAAEVGLLCEELITQPDIDMRWLAIAKTDLQKGFMALVRAVARPTTF